MTPLAYPFSESQVRPLAVGDSVRLNGRIHTGRDRLHKFLFEGGVPPVDLRDSAIYHCGPVVVQETDGSWRVVAAGPTTSSREEPYMAGIITRYGVHVVIGKGGMGPKTLAACPSASYMHLKC